MKSFDNWSFVRMFVRYADSHVVRRRDDSAWWRRLCDGSAFIWQHTLLDDHYNGLLSCRLLGIRIFQFLFNLIDLHLQLLLRGILIMCVRYTDSNLAPISINHLVRRHALLHVDRSLQVRRPRLRALLGCRQQANGRHRLLNLRLLNN